METPVIISMVLLWIVVLFNLLLTFALIRRVNKDNPMDQTPDMLKVGETIPDFKAKTLSGQIVTLADYIQPELVFVFVAYGCPYCSEKMPLLETLHSKAKPMGIEIIVTSLSADFLTQEYVDDLNFKAPILVAFKEETDMAKDYKATFTPSFYYVDAQRKVLARGLLNKEWDKLTDRISNT